MEAFASVLKSSKNIIAVAGAGLSAASGKLPDDAHLIGLSYHSTCYRNPNFQRHRGTMAQIRRHQSCHARSVQREPVSSVAVLPLSAREVLLISAAESSSSLLTRASTQGKRVPAKRRPHRARPLLAPLCARANRTRLFFHAHHTERGWSEPPRRAPRRRETPRTRRGGALGRRAELPAGDARPPV